MRRAKERMGKAPRTMAGTRRTVPPAPVLLVLFLLAALLSPQPRSNPVAADVLATGAPSAGQSHTQADAGPLLGAHAAGAGLTVEISAPDGAAPIGSVTATVTVDRADAATLVVDTTTEGDVTIVQGGAAEYPTVGGFADVTHTAEYVIAEDGLARINVGVTAVGNNGAPLGGQSTAVLLERRGSLVFASTEGAAALALEVFDAVVAPGLSPEQALIQRQDVGVSTTVTTPAPPAGQPRQGVDQIAQQPGEVLLTGDVGWFHRDGDQRRPFIGGTVRAVGLAGQVLDTTATDLLGRYTLSIPPTNGVRIEAETTGAGQAVWIPSEVGVTPHRLVSLRFDMGVGSADPRISLTPASTSETNRAMAVYQALTFARPLADVPADLGLGQIKILYPVGNKSRYVWVEKEIRISEHDAYDWDVILHEFGHQVGRTVGIDDGPGGNHTIGENLAEVLGTKELGMKLAWSEGFATFFGTAVQSELLLDQLGIEGVGDSDYTDIEPMAAFNVEFGVESGRYGIQGAADEVGVARALWDLYDSSDDQGDTVELGFDVMSNLSVSDATDIFDGWHAVVSSLEPALIGEIGCIASTIGLAPGASGPQLTDEEPPIFGWSRGGLGAQLPSDIFRLQIYNDDFSQELLNVNVGSASTYQPSVDEWTAIASSGPIKWMVTGIHSLEPASRPITGCVLRYVPEPIGGVGALNATITDTCLQDRGRIDVEVANSGTVPIDVAVSLTGLSTRVRSVEAGGTVSVPFTGRADGMYLAEVTASGETVAEREIAIECMASSAPPGEAVEVVVKKGCLQNNGRIDVHLTNIGDRTEVYAVFIDQVPAKVRTIAESESMRVTTTGRPDGPRPLRVTRGGVEILSEMVDIACDIDPGGPEVVVVTSCLLERGRFDIYFTNPNETTRTYAVRLSGLTERTITVPGGETLRESITGRSDGTYMVVVRIGNQQIYSVDHEIACG